MCSCACVRSYARAHACACVGWTLVANADAACPLTHSPVAPVPPARQARERRVWHDTLWSAEPQHGRWFAPQASIRPSPLPNLASQCGHTLLRYDLTLSFSSAHALLQSCRATTIAHPSSLSSSSSPALLPTPCLLCCPPRDPSVASRCALVSWRKVQ